MPVGDTLNLAMAAILMAPYSAFGAPEVLADYADDSRRLH
jgi:hypothetical protein